MYMWREMMTERDRGRLKEELAKEPYDPKFDDIDSKKLPPEDLEMKEGLPGSVLQRCYYRWGAVGMWMKLKELSQPEAIVDLAYQRGLPEATRQRLLDALGAKPPAKRPSKVPVWNREQKVLRFEGTVIRKIRSLGVAKNIVTILDGFQAKHWQLRIPTPLDTGQQALHDTIRSLNKGLKKLAFHACDDGQSISWSRR